MTAMPFSGSSTVWVNILGIAILALPSEKKVSSPSPVMLYTIKPSIFTDSTMPPVVRAPTNDPLLGTRLCQGAVSAYFHAEISVCSLLLEHSENTISWLHF